MPADKKAQRAHFLTQRAQMPADQKQQIDNAITALVLQNEIYRTAGTIFLYVSTEEEIDTKAILNDALVCGKTVCVPLCGTRGEMSARQICTWDELAPGAFGILEPARTARVVQPEQIDLAIVPALSCDRVGNRIGYGGGYYDRYLPRTRAVCAALCAEERLTDCLPHETHDFCCHLIITERRVLRTDEEK